MISGRPLAAIITLLLTSAVGHADPLYPHLRIVASHVMPGMGDQTARAMQEALAPVQDTLS